MVMSMLIKTKDRVPACTVKGSNRTVHQIGIDTVCSKKPTNTIPGKAPFRM